MSLQVLMMPMTGLPCQSVASKPPWRSRERWPNERRSLTPSQRWLRRSSERLRFVMRRTSGVTAESLNRQAGGVNDFFPLGGLIGEKLAEIARRARDRNAAEVLEPGLNSGILERQVDLLIKQIDDLLRRSMRYAETKECNGFVTRDGVGDGRHIRQFR